MVQEVRFDGLSELPDELVEQAIEAYVFASGSSTEEEMMVRQWQHSRDYGPFSVRVLDRNGVLECVYETEESMFEVRIPKCRESVTVELYPIGNVTFTQIELAAVNLVNDFPWTPEAFCAWYWGEIGDGELAGVDGREHFEQVRVLQQYFPPRRVTSEPPKCAVLPGAVVEDADFFDLDVRNATHCKTPNPWAYSAVMVVYEDESVAKNIINNEQVHGDISEYELTPPESFSYDTFDD